MTNGGPLIVYKLRYAEGYEWLLPIDEGDFDLLRLDGHPRANSWRPVRMKRLKRSEQGQTLKPSDFPSCSGGDMLILSRAAKEKIGAELERFGELLPLACDEGEFWVFNVTSVVDGLDESRSQVLRASDTGAVLMIRTHAFRPSELARAEVFKLPQTLRGLIYVTRSFLEKVQGAGLAGLEFEQLWPLDERVFRF